MTFSYTNIKDSKLKDSQAIIESYTIHLQSKHKIKTDFSLFSKCNVIVLKDDEVNTIVIYITVNPVLLINKEKYTHFNDENLLVGLSATIQKDLSNVEIDSITSSIFEVKTLPNCNYKFFNMGLFKYTAAKLNSLVCNYAKGHFKVNYIIEKSLTSSLIAEDHTSQSRINNVNRRDYVYTQLGWIFKQTKEKGKTLIDHEVKEFKIPYTNQTKTVTPIYFNNITSVHKKVFDSHKSIINKEEKQIKSLTDEVIELKIDKKCLIEYINKLESKYAWSKYLIIFLSIVISYLSLMSIY